MGTDEQIDFQAPEDHSCTLNAWLAPSLGPLLADTPGHEGDGNLRRTSVIRPANSSLSLFYLELAPTYVAMLAKYMRCATLNLRVA